MNLYKEEIPQYTFKEVGLERIKQDQRHRLLDSLSNGDMDRLFTTKVYNPESEEVGLKVGGVFGDQYMRGLYNRLESEHKVRIETILNTDVNKPKEPYICTGCGHVKGDSIGDHLSCCPDSKYLPLREFIKDWYDDIVRKGMKIVEMKSGGAVNERCIK